MSSSSKNIDINNNNTNHLKDRNKQDILILNRDRSYLNPEDNFEKNSFINYDNNFNNDDHNHNIRITPPYFNRRDDSYDDQNLIYYNNKDENNSYGNENEKDNFNEDENNTYGNENEKDNFNEDENNFNDNENVQNFLKIIQESNYYRSEEIDKMFNEFNNFYFKKEWRVMLMKKYIKKFIEMDFFKIYYKLKIKIIDNQNTYFINSFFKILLEEMQDNSEDIKKFFDIFNYIKNIFTNFNFKIFIIIFLKILTGKEKLPNIWRFINNIYMIKIYNDYKQKTGQKNISILNEGNNLCENLLSIIINNDNFKGEFIYGLYDYIYFKDNFIIKDNNKKEDNLGIYDKFTNFHDGLNNFQENNYLYIYESSKINKSNLDSDWNEYIINTYENKKLNIIYDTLDNLDSYNLKCRNNLYLKIFEMMYKDIKLLDRVDFINAIIALIVNDNKYIFNENLLNMFKYSFGEIIKSITQKIETIFHSIFEGEKKNEEILNSLILFLKLLGEFNNKPFQDMICYNLNILNEKKFIVIEKIYQLYLILLFGKVNKNDKNSEIYKFRIFLNKNLDVKVYANSNQNRIDTKIKEKISRPHKSNQLYQSQTIFWKKYF